MRTRIISLPLFVFALAACLPLHAGAQQVADPDFKPPIARPAYAADKGPVVLLEDLPAQRFAVDDPGRVLRAISQRVEGSIRHRERVESPGVWILQRKIPGQDGVVWQARGDAGVELALVREAVAVFASRLAG